MLSLSRQLSLSRKFVCQNILKNCLHRELQLRQPLLSNIYFHTTPNLNMVAKDEGPKVDGTETEPKKDGLEPKHKPGLPSRGERLKAAVRDYGSTVLVFHISMSLVSLGLCYVAVSSGLDVVGLLSKVGIELGDSALSITSGASTFVIAYAVHKVGAPARIAITLSTTPIIVNRLRAAGILKTPTPRPAVKCGEP